MISDLPGWDDLSESCRTRIREFLTDADRLRDIGLAWHLHRHKFPAPIADAEGWQVFDAYDAS